MSPFHVRLANPDQRDVFGIVVSYSVKVKLFLGALGGELVAELPFVLMHPKVRGTSQIRTISDWKGENSNDI